MCGVAESETGFMRLNLLPHPGSSSDSVIRTSLSVSCDKGTVSQVKKISASAGGSGGFLVLAETQGGHA